MALAHCLHCAADAMTVPESFQDRGFRLALELLKLFRVLLGTDVPPHFAIQLLRAGTSTGANLEEAKPAYSRRDLAAKYTIALREARECRYWLRLIKADQPQLSSQLDDLVDEYSQLIAVLTTSVRKLKIAKKAAETAAVVIVGLACAAAFRLFS